MLVHILFPAQINSTFSVMGQYGITINNKQLNNETYFSITYARKLHLDAEEIGCIVKKTAFHWTIQIEFNSKLIINILYFKLKQKCFSYNISNRNRSKVEEYHPIEILINRKVIIRILFHCVSFDKNNIISW